MNKFQDMLWIEMLKAIRSRMPLWTALGSLFLPLGIAFLIFVARNPQISQQLGLVSAKADIMAYAATDWSTYLTVYAEIIGAGGLILFVLITSWIFGREFADGTLKDILAVPVPRENIVLSKFVVMGIWCEAMTLLILIAGLLLGAILNLQGGLIDVLFQGIVQIFFVSILTISVVIPFALFASIGHGFLLPIGLAILTMIMTNLVQVLGRGEYFPWAVPMNFAMGKSTLPPVSIWIVFLTGLIGVLGTVLWWKYADQNR